jgi:hypothetical protein
LEARLALEKTDLDIVLASIPVEDREEIVELSKLKNGIERQGKKVGALKERYQLFILNVYKAAGMETNFYDFKESKNIQNKLSSFIHSYYFFNTKMTADSVNLKPIPDLIDETENFLRKSTFIEGEGHAIRSIDLKDMFKEDKDLLNEWKGNIKMTEEELLDRLIENINARKK